MTEGRKGGGISWVSGQEGDRRDGRAAGRLLTPTVPHDFRFEEAHRSERRGEPAASYSPSTEYCTSCCCFFFFFYTSTSNPASSIFFLSCAFPAAAGMDLYCSLTHGPEGLSDPHVMPC
uniref:Uncharacterized protein n=1 Tax=Oryza glumipatula TaxID=40148 RepID=A0A0E0AF02_9ORYZ